MYIEWNFFGEEIEEYNLVKIKTLEKIGIALA